MEFKKDVNLAEYSNYKIGGPAKFFFEVKSVEETEWAVKEAKRRGLKIFVLGGGTNLLISDEGYDGLVLKPAVRFLKCDGTAITAGAGTLMSELLDFAAEKGLSGLEWAGGLPGTLGGAIRGNAGAFGGEIKDSVGSVMSLRIGDLKQVTRDKNECKFGYRASIFKESSGEEIILSATLRLNNGEAAEIKKIIREKIDYRLSRQPLEYPNIGSIFKNVPVELVPKDVLPKCADAIKQDPFPIVPAARLIGLTGLKGAKHGGAMISPKHGNFIVNVGDAKAADVKNLINLIKEEVRKKFGIKLEEEIMEL